MSNGHCPDSGAKRGRDGSMNRPSNIATTPNADAPAVRPYRGIRDARVSSRAIHPISLNPVSFMLSIKINVSHGI